MALAVKPLMNAVSRAHERRADAYALRLTSNPPAFISAMRRLGQQNLAEENPSRLVQAFFYTHPPIKERLRAAQTGPPRCVDADQVPVAVTCWLSTFTF